MKHNMILIALTMLVSFSCQREEKPPVEQARRAILQHFELPVYAGMVEVINMELRDHLYQDYHDSEFFDILMNVNIQVRESYKISRIFAHGAFDIDHAWPEIRQARLENAPDEDARQEIIALFESRTFIAGQHEINAVVTMARGDDQWLFLSLFMEPSEEMTEVLPKQMQEDESPV